MIKVQQVNKVGYFYSIKFQIKIKYTQCTLSRAWDACGNNDTLIMLRDIYGLPVVQQKYTKLARNRGFATSRDGSLNRGPEQ